MDSLLNIKFFNYAVVALGLGFVIFIHELGHFLLAKWNRVKVEMFSIGFGPVLLAYRKGVGLRFGSTQAAVDRRLADDPEAINSIGETEYSIRAIPLGGFVKMLGEGEEADREAARTTDPRAYPNKSVGARMAIISAGVIMNVILGLACFAVAYGRGGLMVVPAKIGGVVPGHPAYNAGLETGDTVISVDGRTDLDFISLKRITAMSGPGQVLHLQVKRPGVDRPIPLDVEPVLQQGAEMKQLGILWPQSLQLHRKPFLTPGGLDGVSPLEKSMPSRGRVVAAGPAGQTPRPVTELAELNRLMAAHRDAPVTLLIEPDAKDSTHTGRVEQTLPAVPMLDLGFRARLGPVTAIRPNSPAQAAGLRIGDRIVGIDGIEPLDPLRLPDQLAAHAGQSVTLRVARSEAGKPSETLAFTVTPRASWSWTEPLLGDTPLDLAPLGLAYQVEPVIESVAPGSPAEKAGLKAGDTLAGITLTSPAADGAPEEPVEFKFDGADSSLPVAFSWLQLLPRHEIAVRVKGQPDAIKYTPQPDAAWHTALRGLQFETENRVLPSLALPAAIRRGFEDTRETIVSVYAMFRSLFLGMISPKALGGPLMIADQASQTARAGLVEFIRFLGMLSLNLAVINFLPIPPLDGGQMAFLIAEKLRGRPLPERALNAGTILGLVFVLGLMVFVLFQDVMRYFV